MARTPANPPVWQINDLNVAVAALVAHVPNLQIQIVWAGTQQATVQYGVVPDVTFDIAYGANAYQGTHPVPTVAQNLAADLAQILAPLSPQTTSLIAAIQNCPVT